MHLLGRKLIFVTITSSPVRLRSECILQKTRQATCAWFCQRTSQLSKIPIHKDYKIFKTQPSLGKNSIWVIVLDALTIILYSNSP